MGRINEQTHALLNNLNILKTDPDPPRASKMPASLSRQILNHNATQNDKFRFHAVQDAVVREVQTVSDFNREPGKVLMRCQGVLGGFVVGFVDLVEPVAAALAVCVAGLPVFAGKDTCLVR